MKNSQKSVLNVAILAMVNRSAVHSMHNTTFSTECPQKSQQNTTTLYKEGSYVWTQTVQGIILGSYYYGLILAQFLGGTITFLLGPKRIFIISSFLSSIFTILTPFCADVGVSVISLCQVILGFVQGLILLASFTLLGRWSPENEKSILSSVSISGIQVGTFVGLLTTGYICEHKEWTFSFYTFGICGIVLSVCVTFTVYDRPREHPRISEKELTFLNENVTNVASGQTKLNIPWKEILTSRGVWIVALTKICCIFSYVTIMTKFPSYLQNVLHFPIQQTGLMNALIYFTESVSIIISGFIADFTRARTHLSITNIRKISQTIGTFGSAACILAISFLGCESTEIIICLIIAMACYGFNNSGEVVIVFDLAPEFAGVLFGLSNGLCCISAILAPYVAGIILEKYEGDLVQWNYIFYMTSFAYFLGGVIFLLGATAEVQPWAINTDKRQDSN
ncbi:sialin-like [Centruroides vittatus]|uniref:sialin-like n=1 Tax=Centruroides vittatus TaxID=120091 RepID=UPI0035104998